MRSLISSRVDETLVGILSHEMCVGCSLIPLFSTLLSAFYSFFPHTLRSCCKHTCSRVIVWGALEEATRRRRKTRSVDAPLKRFYCCQLLIGGESVLMAWTDDNLGRRRNPGYGYNTDQVQLRVDPRDQLDDEISGLRKQVNQLKQVAQHIDTETRYQNELLSQLEDTVAKGQAMLKSTTRRLSRTLAQRGISPLYLAIGFALLCFFFVYLYTKLFRRH